LKRLATEDSFSVSSLFTWGCTSSHTVVELELCARGGEGSRDKSSVLITVADTTLALAAIILALGDSLQRLEVLLSLLRWVGPLEKGLLSSSLSLSELSRVSALLGRV